MHDCRTSSDPLRLHIKRRPRGDLASYRRAPWGRKAAGHKTAKPAGRANSPRRGGNRLPDRAAGRHLEGEAEARQVLARMVVGERELRQPVVVRPRLLALVDRRVEIDEMPAGLAGRLHDDLDVALAVEAAGIARDRVVVDQRVDVGGLAPAAALDVDAESGAGRTARDIETECRRRDPEGALLLALGGVDPEIVHAAEIIGRLEGECDVACRIGFGLSDLARLLLPPSAGHAVANNRIPIERVGFARLEARARNRDLLANAAECRRCHERALWR